MTNILLQLMSAQPVHRFTAGAADSLSISSRLRHSSRIRRTHGASSSKILDASPRILERTAMTFFEELTGRSSGRQTTGYWTSQTAHHRTNWFNCKNLADTGERQTSTLYARMQSILLDGTLECITGATDGQLFFRCRVTIRNRYSSGIPCLT